MNFGAHVSVAGGLQNGITRGKAIGAEVLQIFVSAPQSFRTTAYSDEQIGEFKKLYQDAGFRGLFLHAIYLINLASENDGAVDRSINSLIHYLNMGDKIGAVGTIVHLGSFVPSSSRILPRLKDEQGERSQQVSLDEIPRQARDDKATDEIVPPTVHNDNVDRFTNMVISIKAILDKTPQSQQLIVENCAGSKIGKDLDELVRIDKAVNSPRLTFCIDTQHLFVSGVDVRDYNIFETWLNDFNGRIGIDKLSCIHANDSKTELGSGADRHENIGEGTIGIKGFTNILRQPLLQNKPFILEVPGIDKKGPDEENIDRLRDLV